MEVTTEVRTRRISVHLSILALSVTSIRPLRRPRRTYIGAVSLRRANVLGVSCAAGSACRSRSGAAVAANDVRRTELRTATAVTPSRWRCHRQLGCRAEAGPHQLHTKVRRRHRVFPTKVRDPDNLHVSLAPKPLHERGSSMAGLQKKRRRRPYPFQFAGTRSTGQ